MKTPKKPLTHDEVIAELSRPPKKPSTKNQEFERWFKLKHNFHKAFRCTSNNCVFIEHKDYLKEAFEAGQDSSLENMPTIRKHKIACLEERIRILQKVD